MLATPTPEYRSPKRHREECEQARAWSKVPYVIDGVLVYVGDFDAHLARARAAGATILPSPTASPAASVATAPKISKVTAGCSSSAAKRQRSERTRQTRFSNVSSVSSTSSGPLRSCTVPCTRRGGSAVRT